MQLADIGLVRGRLTLPDDEGTNGVISDALDAATAHIEAVLQTAFDRSNYADTFKVDTGIYSSYSGLFRLKLSNGFVVPDSIVVEMTDTLFTENPGWVQLAASDYLFSSPEKGFVDVQDSPPRYGYATRFSADVTGPYVRDKFIRVSYEAGFLDDLDSVPGWLQEAAFSYAVKMLSLQQVGDDKPALAKVYALLDSHKATILDRHLRISSRAIPPILSV